MQNIQHIRFIFYLINKRIKWPNQQIKEKQQQQTAALKSIFEAASEQCWDLKMF